MVSMNICSSSFWSALALWRAITTDANEMRVRIHVKTRTVTIAAAAERLGLGAGLMATNAIAATSHHNAARIKQSASNAGGSRFVVMYSAKCQRTMQVSAMRATALHAMPKRHTCDEPSQERKQVRLSAPAGRT